MDSQPNPLPADLKDVIQEFEAKVGAVEKLIEPLLQVPMKDFYDKISPLDQAKFNVMLAYAINSLFFMYLRTQGISPNTHPVKQELERIRLYIKKVKAIAGEKGREQDAARRFILHGLNVKDPLKTAETATDKEAVDAKNMKEKKERKKDKKEKNELPEADPQEEELKKRKRDRTDEKQTPKKKIGGS